MDAATILIIDDDIMLVKAISNILTPQYTVYGAYSGAEGLETARHTNPNLIVLDVMMADMDGFETCRALRNNPRLHDIPILFLSAVSTTQAKITGFQAGADDYLAKPFAVEELLARISVILRRKREHGPVDASIARGNIFLNRQTRQVQTPHSTHQLTTTEFDLLYYFMQHAGEVLSVKQLLRDVWRYNPDASSPNLVRMHVKNLRQKIEPNPQHPVYLKTVVKKGYILAVPHL